jgi:hypothetical protein
MGCHSGMHSNKVTKRTSAQLIDSTEVGREFERGEIVSPVGSIASKVVGN